MSLNFDPNSLREPNPAEEAARGRSGRVSAVDVVVFLTMMTILMLWLLEVISLLTALLIIAGLGLATLLLFCLLLVVGTAHMARQLQSQNQQLHEELISLRRRTSTLESQRREPPTPGEGYHF